MKNEMRRILIVGVHGPYEPWTSILQEGQLETWSDVSRYKSISIVHGMGIPVAPSFHKFGEYLYSLKYAGNPYLARIALVLDVLIKKITGNLIFRVKEAKISENFHKLEVQMPDFSLFMGNKMLSILKYCLENIEFDFLVTTISSTYIHKDNLIKVVDDLPKSKVLAGRFVDLGTEHFQQGAFRIYSRDVVEYIISNRRSYSHWAPEDVAMGRLVKNGNFTEHTIPYLTIDSVTAATEIDPIKLSTISNFRCKGATQYGNKLRMDIPILKIIHSKIKS